MISKIIKPGKSFAGACGYLLNNRERAEVILSEGVRNYDYLLMTADFESQRQLNPALKSPVQHIILSWCAGEILSNEKMSEIAIEYLKRVQVFNTQFAIVRHDDRDNPHVHILFNRVDNNGRTVKDNFLGLRGKKAAQQITHEYGLIPAIRKDLQHSQMERMNGYDATRYEIFQIINDLLPKCHTFEELKSHLKQAKVEMVYKFKGQTNEVQGISFIKGNLKFKGSEIDRAFSFRNLQNTLAQMQQQSLLKTQARSTKTFPQEESPDFSQASRLLYELMKPEFTPDFVPDQLMKSKKKRRKSLGL